MVGKTVQGRGPRAQSLPVLYLMALIGRERGGRGDPSPFPLQPFPRWLPAWCLCRIRRQCTLCC